jgi:hypothetical protein
MRQLQGRETSLNQKLEETVLKRKEHFERMFCLMKTLDQDGTNIELNHYIAILHLQVGMSLFSFVTILFKHICN